MNSVIPSPSVSDPVLFDTPGASGSYRRSFIQRGADASFHAFSPDRSLPVLGRAQGGDDGNVVIEEHPIDWTFRPADLQGVDDAFAVFVSGNSMMPKYKNGDLVYVHPSRPLAKSRFALIETKENKGFIKQFVGWQGENLVLHQFNPDMEVVLEREQVLRVMLAIGSLDC